MRIFHDQSVKKSQKRRQCDWCGEAIEIGQPYHSHRFASEGGAGTATMHPECNVAANKLAASRRHGVLWYDIGDYKRGSINER